MKAVWIIAFLVLILFGFSAAFSFLEIVAWAVLIFLALGSAFMVISGIIDKKIGQALCWAVPAVFFGWILSLCF